jgi:hypothetical protein
METLNYTIKIKESNILIQQENGIVSYDGERTLKNEETARLFARELPNYTIIEEV